MGRGGIATGSMDMTSFDEYSTVSDFASEDIIDSRDMESVIESLEEIQSAHDDWTEEDGTDRPEPLDEDQAATLKVLREVRDACGREWIHGVTYIRETYWKDYAQQLAEDIGAIPKDLSWPACHIDWDEAADALAQDYSSIEIGGVSFYYRD